MVRDKEITRMVSRAIKLATPGLTDLAKRLGVSYDAVRSWSIGRTTPKQENLGELADYMDEQADRLRGMAAELRRKSEDDSLF